MHTTGVVCGYYYILQYICPKIFVHDQVFIVVIMIQPLSMRDIQKTCDELPPPALCVASQTCDGGVHKLNCPDFFAHHPFHKSPPPN